MKILQSILLVILGAGTFAVYDSAKAGDVAYMETVRLELSVKDREVFRALVVANGGVDETSLRRLTCVADSNTVGGESLYCDLEISKVASSDTAVTAIDNGKQVRIIAKKK